MTVDKPKAQHIHPTNLLRSKLKEFTNERDLKIDNINKLSPKNQKNHVIKIMREEILILANVSMASKQMDQELIEIFCITYVRSKPDACPYFALPA